MYYCILLRTIVHYCILPSTTAYYCVMYLSMLLRTTTCYRVLPCTTVCWLRITYCVLLCTNVYYCGLLFPPLNKGWGRGGLHNRVLAWNRLINPTLWKGGGRGVGHNRISYWSTKSVQSIQILDSMRILHHYFNQLFYKILFPTVSWKKINWIKL